jgi:hypothetical protein
MFAFRRHCAPLRWTARLLCERLGDRLTPSNAPIARDEFATGREEVPLVINALSNDIAPDGDPLTLAVLSAQNGTAVVENNQLLFTSDRDFSGLAEVRYSVSDGQGNSAIATAFIRINPVNDAPTLTAPVTVTGPQDQSLAVPDVRVGDVDSPMVQLTLTVNVGTLTVGTLTVGTLTVGTLTLTDSPAALNALLATISYAPPTDFVGTATLTLTVSDLDANGPLSAQTTVALTITAVNAPPVASPVQVTTPASTPIVLALPVSDPNNDPLTVTVQTSTGGMVSVAGLTLTFTPTAGFAGTGGATYEVSDGQGGTASNSVTVIVLPAPLPPPPPPPQAPIIRPDTATTTGSPIQIPVLENDTDPDGGPLTVVSVTGNQGTVQIGDDGVLLYVPPSKFAGIDSFVYTASNPNGGSGSANVSVTVDPPIDRRAPIIRPDNITITGSGPAFLDVLANDQSLQGFDLNIVGITQPQNGSVVINGQGGLTYTPQEGFTGTDSFSYTASDGNGGFGSATVSLSVARTQQGPGFVLLATANTLGTADTGAARSTVETASVATPPTVPTGALALANFTTAGEFEVRGRVYWQREPRAAAPGVPERVVILEVLTERGYEPVRQMTTDEKGEYRFEQLPAGTYRVRLRDVPTIVSPPTRVDTDVPTAQYDLPLPMPAPPLPANGANPAALPAPGVPMPTAEATPAPRAAGVPWWAWWTGLVGLMGPILRERRSPPPLRLACVRLDAAYE